MSSRRIVAVSIDPDVQQLAQRYGREVFGADDPLDALDVVERVYPNLVLLDDRFNRRQIHEFFRRADNHFADIPVVVVGGDGSDAESSAEFTQMGARDVLQGRQDYSRLERIIETIEDNPGTDHRNCKQMNGLWVTEDRPHAAHFFAEDLAGSVSMVGRSPAILNALKMIRLVAKSRCNPILIVGETGTGKELAARAVHLLRHPDDEFVAVNCAALTASLLESELFGHVKGAFTGADRDKTGLLEWAGSGTLLLDEISEMPMDLQAKLLRVLQERTFRKVGGIKDLACNATIMASSNRNLKSEVEANRFRRDLYYRLDVSPIVLAPLRSQERCGDVRLLAEYFLKTSTICPEKRNRVTSLTRLALEALEKHDWPGNVRELRNVIDRAILLETTDKIGLSGIVIDPTQCAQASENPAAGLIKGFSLAKAEHELIARALRETGWQKTRAAALLGITRATLYAKVKQYNISKDPCAASDRADKPGENAAAAPVSELASTY
ncbi:MAG: sigma-54-dependent Fis family transcriptional regulator [Phycisphaerales bacterium]|nr:MAG: sigma-54-dependent Fis family transcriptional regulator [Phycisphaerales bacterium]